MRSFRRTYSELATIPDYAERYRYLQLRGNVGEATFGYDRYLNQDFYRSAEWKRVRNQVITRDLGCDMGVEGYEIHERILIHHMNPMNVDDVVHSNPDILNPEFLISVTHATHNAIHYGDESLLALPLVERSPGDTRLW